MKERSVMQIQKIVLALMGKRGSLYNLTWIKLGNIKCWRKPHELLLVESWFFDRW